MSSSDGSSLFANRGLFVPLDIQAIKQQQQQQALPSFRTSIDGVTSQYVSKVRQYHEAKLSARYTKPKVAMATVLE